MERNIELENVISAQLSKDGFEAFIVHLALGTLVAIKERIVDPDVGIWTQGRPNFWEDLEREDCFPKEVIDIFKSSDEISVLLDIDPDEGERLLDANISKLKSYLSTIGEPSWNLTWDGI